MTVLITGITGFVGGYLAGILTAGKKNKIFGTYLEDPVSFNNAGVDLHRLNITDAGSIVKLLEDIRPSKIYHLAAIAATTEVDPNPYYKVNFHGTLNLLEAVRRIVPKCRVLFIGSANVYGPVPVHQQPIREDLELRPVNHYASSKAAADMAAFCYAANGLDVVIARPFNHTGPGQSIDFIGPKIAKQVAEIMLGTREPVIEVGNLEATRDFTDVRDVVNAYRMLMNRGRSGEVYNVCSQQVYSVRDIIHQFVSMSGVNGSVKSRSDLLRKTDISILKGSREKITSETGWCPAIKFSQTCHDLLLYWKNKLS